MDSDKDTLKMKQNFVENNKQNSQLSDFTVVSSSTKHIIAFKGHRFAPRPDGNVIQLDIMPLGLGHLCREHHVHKPEYSLKLISG